MTNASKCLINNSEIKTYPHFKWLFKFLILHCSDPIFLTSTFLQSSLSGYLCFWLLCMPHTVYPNIICYKSTFYLCSNSLSILLWSLPTGLQHFSKYPIIKPCPNCTTYIVSWDSAPSSCLPSSYFHIFARLISGTFLNLNLYPVVFCTSAHLLVSDICRNWANSWVVMPAFLPLQSLLSGFLDLCSCSCIKSLPKPYNIASGIL